MIRSFSWVLAGTSFKLSRTFVSSYLGVVRLCWVFSLTRIAVVCVEGVCVDCIPDNFHALHFCINRNEQLVY